MAGTSNETLSIDEAAQPTESLIRSLAVRYLFVLAAVAALIVADQVIIQPLLVQLSGYAPAINVAGRQRMLSQKLTKAALALQNAVDERHRDARRQELNETLTQWRTAYWALREGSDELGIPQIQSADMEREWERLRPHFEAMCAAAETLHSSLQETDRGEVDAAAAIIINHEAAFLVSMDRIVKLMEMEAASAVLQLRICAATIAAAIIVLMLALGWFVMRPATRTIRRQVDELELQVHVRTRELSAALNSLRHEIAEREGAEVKNQRLAAQLAHAARLSTMGHLTAGLAHELNQPLATIANYAEACDVALDDSSDGAPTVQLRRYLQLSKQAALRAGQIVRRMRNFVRPNSAAAVEIEINDLIREVAELCRTEADQTGADMVLELADQRAVASVDPIQLQQVLVNLVQNALQAMVECPIHQRRLRIRTSVEMESVQIDVTDSGPGFASIDQETVFAPFYTTKPDGLGIGLSICRSIVEAHRGTIWAEAAPGGGAKLSFTLPLAEVNVGSRRTYTECLCR